MAEFERSNDISRKDFKTQKEQPDWMVARSKLLSIEQWDFQMYLWLKTKVLFCEIIHICSIFFHSDINRFRSYLQDISQQYLRAHCKKLYI